MAVSVRRAATRERIIAAAMEVFARRSVQVATVEEICEAAGFTRGAFYSNYESKVELCAEIMDINTKMAAQAARQAVDSIDDFGTDPDEFVSRAISVFLESTDFAAERMLAICEMRLWAAREPELRPAIARLEDSFSPIFDELINEGLRRHHSRLTLSTADAVKVLRGVHDGNVVEQLLHSATIDTAVIGRVLSAVLRSLIVPLDD